MFNLEISTHCFMQYLDRKWGSNTKKKKKKLLQLKKAVKKASKRLSILSTKSLCGAHYRPVDSLVPCDLKMAPFKMFPVEEPLLPVIGSPQLLGSLEKTWFKASLKTHLIIKHFVNAFLKMVKLLFDQDRRSFRAIDLLLF